MLPGVARVPPGRGPPGPAPGRGCGRGIGRSTGCCEENGLLPTRGGRGAPGLGPPACAGPGRGPGVGAGPGRAPGVGAGPGRAAGAAGRALAAGAWGAAGAAGSCGAGAAGGAGGADAAGAAGAGAAGLGALGRGPGTGEAVATPPLDGVLPEPLEAAGDGRPLAAAGLGAPPRSADLPPPKDSRRRRATGASTVDDADLTNSPCSLNRARTCLLVTPSSLANSCTRALPATTSPVWRRQRWVAPRLGFSYDAWSSGLHGVLMFFAACSVAVADRGRQHRERHRRTRPPRRCPVDG